jgi:hypothetical protein
MANIADFLKVLLYIAPLEFLVALLRLLLLPILSLLAVIIHLVHCLLRLWPKTSLFEEEKEDACPPLPEAVVRRPDPCLYSQSYLQAQGLPVTWNNPDIWLAPASDPNAVEPDSYHLEADTDYIVSVRVHNAATDLALGVQVRMLFRHWSINAPDFVPVQRDTSGNEVFRHVDVDPMGATVTQFHWRTPAVPPGEAVRHYCLQARLWHPMDVNPDNNVGQENTNVYAANPGHVAPGEIVRVEIPLHNPTRVAQRFRFEPSLYEIDARPGHQLTLRTNRGFARMPLSARIANLVPTLHPKTVDGQAPPPPPPGVLRAAATRLPTGMNLLSDIERFRLGRFEIQARRRLKVVKTKYVGFEAVHAAARAQVRPLPPAMAITVDGAPVAGGVALAPGEMRPLQFEIKVPDDALPTARFPLNLLARAADGSLAGGVTLLLEVKE